MITFYQWNKTFRTLDHSPLSPLSKQVQELMSKNDDLLINGYQKQSYKTCKKATLKQRTKRTGKPTLKTEQDTQGTDYEETPLKNLAIRERLTTLTPCKDSFMVRNTLIISKIHVNKCKISFQKYASKRAKEGLACSVRQDSTITSERKNKPTFNHRYSARRCEIMSEEPSYSPRYKNKPQNQRGGQNLNNKLKVLTDIIDKYKETAPQLNNRETLLTKFLKFQQKNQQQTITYGSLVRKKPIKTENIEEEQLYLSPSRRKSYRNSEQTNMWGRYRRSTSNYKTTYNESPKIHKKSLHSISYSWQSQGEPNNI